MAVKKYYLILIYKTILIWGQNWSTYRKPAKSSLRVCFAHPNKIL